MLVGFHLELLSLSPALMHSDTAGTAILRAKCSHVSVSPPPCVFSKYSRAWIRHACPYQQPLTPRRRTARLGEASEGRSLRMRRLTFGRCAPLFQNSPRRRMAKRTTRRRVLNSVSGKTGQTTTTHQTSPNCLKWSITAPMGRARGVSAPHELLK